MKPDTARLSRRGFGRLLAAAAAPPLAVAAPQALTSFAPQAISIPQSLPDPAAQALDGGAASEIAGPAVPLSSQAPSNPAAPLSREEELRAANERRIATAQVLAQFNLPMATEPAFVFRP